MRLRTFLGILLALVVVVTVAYLSTQNLELLKQRFFYSQTGSIPVFGALLAAFLLGFLPAVSVLLSQQLQRELAERRQRKRSREVKSLERSFRRAVDFQADGQWGKAAGELESCLDDRPEEFSTLLRYGEVLRRQGRPDDALEIHRRASVLYPRSVAILYQLADDYEVRGEVEVAMQIRERVLRDFPGLGLKEFRRRRDRALVERDWRESARLQEKIETLLAEGADGGDLAEEEAVRLGLNYQKVVDALEADQYDEAKRLLDRVLAADAQFIPGLLLAGELEALRGDEPAAVAGWRRGYSVTGNPLFLLRIEDHFIEREEPLEAIETLHSLIAEASSVGSDLVPRFFLGRLYYRLEMHEEAMRVFEPLSERIEGSPTLHYFLARIHQRRGEMGQAVEAYQACVHKAGITAAQFRCAACRTEYPEWHDRCDVCGSWSSIELEFDEEAGMLEELGLEQIPRRAVYDRESLPEG